MHDASQKKEEDELNAPNPAKKQSLTRYAADNQQELTIADTPLYIACEEIVKAKANLALAKGALEDAEEACIKEMKEQNKKTITHKGDTLELVDGRTTEDHIRFKKQ